MSWSKVHNKHSKPLGWWWHKIMCELFYGVHDIMWLPGQTRAWFLGEYYGHLNILCIKYKFNLYGDCVKSSLEYKPAKVVKTLRDSSLVIFGDPAYNDVIELYVPNKFIVGKLDNDTLVIDEQFYIDECNKLLQS
jgi:hypothetical protein